LISLPGKPTILLWFLSREGPPHLFVRPQAETRRYDRPKAPSLCAAISPAAICRFDGRLWVWDKTADRVVQTSQARSPWKRISTGVMNSKSWVAIRSSWKAAIRNGRAKCLSSPSSGSVGCGEIERGQRIEIPEPNRDIAARFMAVQFLRTADTRDTLEAVHATDHPEKLLSKEERAGLHTELMWDIATVDLICKPY